MEEVILHIGMHKTGTSSIQETLAGFDDGETIYSSLGVRQATPIRTVFGKNTGNQTHWKRRGVHGAELDKIRAEYVSILDRETRRKNRRRLIISAESIWTLGPDVKANLIEYFSERRLRVTAVCYVREFQGYTASWFQQTVKGGGCEIAAPKVNLRPRLEAFRTSAGVDQIVVREFAADKLKNGCVVQDFCDLVGVRPDQVINTNEGLSSSALKLLFHFNEAGPLSDGERRLKVARNKFVKLVSEAYQGKKPDRSLFSHLVPSWEEDYRYLEESYDICLTPPDLTGNRQSLEDFLADLSDVDPASLDGLLLASDVDPSLFTTTTDKLSILYYSVLAEFASKRLNRPRLGSHVRRFFGVV